MTNDENIKTLLQGDLLNYRPPGWDNPANYASWAEYVLKMTWYAGIKDEKSGLKA